MAYEAYHFALLNLEIYIPEHRLIGLIAELNIIKDNIALKVDECGILRFFIAGYFIGYLK